MARDREHAYNATVTWAGPQAGSTTTYAAYSRRHEIVFDGKPATLTGSADPAFRGESTLPNPEELLVASLASCHMLSYLALAALNGIEVVSYVDRAHGVMLERGGAGRFISVTLAPSVRIARETDLANAIALHDAAHAQCFIANSVNFPVEHRADVAVADGEPA